jgi:Trk K+ transport system NAD-binding subunit
MSQDDLNAAVRPVLLVGLGKIGFSILKLLNRLDIPVVAVTRGIPPDWLKEAERLAHRLIRGDGRSYDILCDAGIDTARAIIIATNDDLVNLEVLLDAQRHAPQTPVVVRMLDTGLAARTCRDFNVQAALNAAEISTPAFVAAALGEDLLRAFEIEGKSLHVVSRTAKADVSVEALETADGERKPICAVRRLGEEFVVLPSPSTAVSAGDEVVSVEIRGRHRKRYSGGRKPVEPWILPRISPWSFAVGAVKHGAGPLRWLLAGLAIMITLSAYVFHRAMDLAWIDAFYFTVTIITTVGFGDINLSGAPTWVKLYGCALMLTGVSMLVFLYGLFTDYLVRMRVEEAFGPKRTALREHIIVAGTGDLGARIARRLHSLGVPTLAVEREADSSSAQSLPADLPVLHGDATLRSTMERAGAVHARAVLAVTDDDMTNLRIAQQTEDVNREGRTVVRLFQSLLAAKLGASLGADVPLNPSEAAAATFVACSLRRDVLHGFTVGESLLVIRKISARELEVDRPRTAADLYAVNREIVLLRSRGDGEPFTELSEADLIEPDDRLIVLEEYREYSAGSLTS